MQTYRDNEAPGRAGNNSPALHSGKGAIQGRAFRGLGLALGVALFSAALFVLHRLLREYSYHDIIRELHALPSLTLLSAAGLTFASYAILTGYDNLSLVYLGKRLGYARTTFASFIGYAFSNNMGLPVLTGGSVRFRLYSAWGLSAVDIAKLVAFNSVTFWTGICAVGGAVFVMRPVALTGLIHVPFGSLVPIGLTGLCLAACYVLLCLFRKEPVRLRQLEFRLPSPGICLTQIAVSSADWLAAGSVCYVLVSSVLPLHYTSFMAVFMFAQMGGLVSQVPGGLGVFETVMLLTLSPAGQTSSLMGALIAYRAIYYILPLAAAAVMLGVQEAARNMAPITRAARGITQGVNALVPDALAVTTFLGGVVLLFSGSTPELIGRMRFLGDILPLPVMEISHFLGSLAGLGLLVLARGLKRRLDAAYVLATLMLGAGVIFSMLKGFDYEEATILGVMLLVLLPARRHFYRKASFFGRGLDAGWAAAVILVIASSVWLGMFSYKHVEYSGELWWKFSLHGDAPRFMRASVGVIAATFFLALYGLMRPRRPKPAPAEDSMLGLLRNIVSSSPGTYANLALLGDKSILFSDSGESFIMYGVEGRSWVSMGDPVGRREEMAELAWRFREMCDRHDGWTVFYEVHPENLGQYIELGLDLLKIGEEARVRLADFSLEGGGRKGMRNACHRLDKDGYTFSVVSGEELGQLMPELKSVSDSWLAEKNTREKGFSLGFFNPEYIGSFPVAVVRREGAVTAFGNVWQGAKKHEMSIDLMRYVPDAPNGIMDYLFVNLMLWGRREEYEWFNMGMAPLSGLVDRPFAPLWSRLGGRIFTHGEHFYNFKGLRQYKEKFDPVWEPRYVASPGGLTLPLVLANISALVSRGMKGVVGK